MIFSENRYTLFGIMLYAARRLRVHPRLAVIFTLGRAAARRRATRHWSAERP